MFGDEGPQGSIIERSIKKLEESYARDQREVHQRTADQISESLAQKGRPKSEASRPEEKDQVSEPLQGDLFNADPKTEKQLDLLSALPGDLGKTGGNKKTVKADQKGKGKTSKGGVRLEQTQRIGVRTTGYIQHRGLVVESDADVAAFLATL